MKRFSFYSLMLAVLALGFTSCEKDDQVNGLGLDALDASAASSTTEQVIADLQSLGDEAIGGDSFSSSLKSFSLADSTTIMPDNSIVPNRNCFRFNKSDSTSISVDFGTGVSCRDGKLRKGKFTVTRAKSPSFDREGNTIVFTTEGYMVDGFEINVTKTITCLGWNVSNDYPNGYLEYHVVVTDGLIVRPNGDTIIFNIDRNRKLVANNDLQTFAGWAVNGTSNQTITRKVSGRELSSSSEITRDLLRPLKYHYFVAGEVDLTLKSGAIVTIDYGTGNLFDPTTWSNKRVVKSENSIEVQQQ